MKEEQAGIVPVHANILRSPAAPATGTELLEAMLAPEASAPTGLEAQAAVVVGTIAATGAELRVRWEGQAEPVRARATVPVSPGDVGREVTLVFERGDRRRPIVTGVLRLEQGGETDFQLEVDGKALVLEAQEQIVLRCGKASITLTRSGKVLVQGAYLSSRSTGLNRIKGGSVQIN